MVALPAAVNLLHLLSLASSSSAAVITPSSLPSSADPEKLLLSINELHNTDAVTNTSTLTTVVPTATAASVVLERTTDSIVPDTAEADVPEVHLGRERGSNVVLDDSTPAEEPVSTTLPTTADDMGTTMVTASTAVGGASAPATSAALPTAEPSERKSGDASAATTAAADIGETTTSANTEASAGETVVDGGDEANESASTTESSPVSVSATDPEPASSDKSTTERVVDPTQSSRVTVIDSDVAGQSTEDINAELSPAEDATGDESSSTPTPGITDPSMGEMKINIGPIVSKHDRHGEPGGAPATAPDSPVTVMENYPDPATGAPPSTTDVPLSRHRPEPGLAPSEIKQSKGRTGVDPTEMVNKLSKARTGVLDLEMPDNPSKPRKGAPVPQDDGVHSDPANHISTTNSTSTKGTSGAQDSGKESLMVTSGGGPSTATVFGAVILVCLVLVIGFLAFRKCRESWYRRHYRKMDFLVDGMYNL